MVEHGDTIAILKSAEQKPVSVDTALTLFEVSKDDDVTVYNECIYSGERKHQALCVFVYSSKRSSQPVAIQ